MVGMWKPEPPHEEYDENLFTAETGIVVVEQDSSDSEDEDAVHSGYQLLAQGPNDLNNTENEDDSVSADILPGSSVADVIVADPVDSEDAGASHVVLDQCNLENDRRAEVKELWSGSSNGNAIEMGLDQAERVRIAMEKFSLPPLSIPAWALEVSGEQWKQQLLDRAKRLQQGD
ncbi:uncharacterized protein LOC110838814 [Zootermopsis nevadensis]|nr:uncharacterized protein LOC110838814 [Zootermopsis nevadensis]XP_021938110.1 uncharacterized protein LOC110838814 [Zootermopsis nevadensis]